MTHFIDIFILAVLNEILYNKPEIKNTLIGNRIIIEFIKKHVSFKIDFCIRLFFIAFLFREVK